MLRSGGEGMSAVRVKICGVMTFADALMAAEAGAALLGFNFYKRSPRYLTPEAAHPICEGLRSQLGVACPVLVGVFVNENVWTITAVMNQARLHCAQLSGDESDAVLRELRGTAFKAIRPANEAQALDDVGYYSPVMPTDVRMPSLLLDAYQPGAYGGTGQGADVELARRIAAQVPRLMLAGGLTPENVAARIAAVEPWGVDVASGVEPPDQPGVKDAGRVRAFIEAARSG